MDLRGASGAGHALSRLEELNLHCEELLRASRAKTTLASYDRLAEDFAVFATDLARPSLPAMEDTVELYLVWIDLQGHGGQARASWAQSLGTCACWCGGSHQVKACAAGC